MIPASHSHTYKNYKEINVCVYLESHNPEVFSPVWDLNDSFSQSSWSLGLGWCAGWHWNGVGGDEDGGFLAANYLFVFMTAVSSAPFEEPGIMRTPASHNMFSLL